MEHFVELVRQYVELIDSRRHISADVLLRQAGKLLPQIYASGLDLPDCAPTSREAPPHVESPMTELAAIPGTRDVYAEVFHPIKDVEAIRTTLSVDLADIFIDLKGPLVDFDAGRVDDAIWSWRFTLAGHCGDHIVDSMRAIHRHIHEDTFRLAPG
jgi:hypothetical protein